MNRFFKYIFFAIFSLATVVVYGQNIKFKTLSTHDGLSNNSVNDIVNDKDGALWIATWDGLNQYDGNSFKVYNHSQNDSTSIASNEIIQLIKDRNHDIWIMTNSASISKYIGNNKFKNYVLDESPSNLFISKEGNLVIWYRDKDEYFEYKNGKFVKTFFKNIKQENNIVLNNILLSKFPNLIINESLRDSKGNIWYATRNKGLYIISSNANNINNEIIDHYEYDLYSPYSFTSNEIENLYEDDFGNVWLGHKDGGLSMAYAGSEQINIVAPHPIKYPHLPNETIRAITKGSDGNIWLGYYTQGLYYYSSDSKCYLKYEISKSVQNTDWNRIRSLYTTSDGTIWAGTYAGLIQIKKGKSTYISASEYPNFPNNRNYSLYEDQQKQVWIACWGGLAKFNLRTQKFEKFEGQEELKNSKIRKVVVNGNDIILGTENSGVVLFDAKSGKSSKITTENGILGNSIFGILKDEKTNYYWIASLGGISVYHLDKGIIKNITKNNGLPSHMVYSLLSNNNKIWISTTNGIAAIDKNDFSVLSLNPNEGWQAAEFSEGAYYQDSKGTLFFGGINGLNYFHPTKIKFSKELPNIKVTVDNLNNIGKNIVKSYSENNLKIEINPISFTENLNNKILYKLVGLDKEWKIFMKNPINYKDLPYGFYTLNIKNSLAHNEEILIELDVEIEKPFYATLWFITILGLVILFSVTYWVASKNRKAKQYQRILKRRIEERTKIIDQQKEDLIQSNSELDRKNKEILSQKEQLLKLHHNLKNEDFEIDKFKTFVFNEFKPLISKILANSNNLNNQDLIKNNIATQSGKLINLLSEWDYLGQVKDLGATKKSAIKLNAFIKVLIEDLKVQMIKSKVNLEYNFDIQDEWIKLDVLRFKLLFKYLFNVIIKFSPENSSIKLNIKSNFEIISIQVITNNKILIDNFVSIQHYSPYFKAVNTLVSVMDGSIITKTGDEFVLKLKIPAEIINMDSSIVQEVSWNHLNVDEELPSNKNNILVFCDENDNLPVLQILDDPENNLLYENSTSSLLSILKLKKIDILVLYNTPITDKIIQLLNVIRKTNFQIAVPILYISEQINYFLQEETLELGVDAFIQLPISKSFIQKKLLKLLKVRKNYLNDKNIQEQLFNINSDQEQILSPNEKLIKKALEIIKTNMIDPSFNVEMLKDKLEISQIKCYRVFKEVLSQSPSDVIINFRLQKAEYLLKNKKLNISEISYECGFNDPKYFSRLFRKNFGFSPKEFKVQIKH